jgi:hypothetical protein
LIWEPPAYAGRQVRTRLYGHERALGKLRWFLNDFGYDSELMAAEELDDRQVVGREGVIRLAPWGADGHPRLDVPGFAPGERWPEVMQEPIPCPASAQSAQP